MWCGCGFGRATDYLMVMNGMGWTESHISTFATTELKRGAVGLGQVLDTLRMLNKTRLNVSL